jgi:hypothetical protein
MYIFNKFIVDVLLQKELIHLFEFWLLWIQDVTTRKFQFFVCVGVCVCLSVCVCVRVVEGGRRLCDCVIRLAQWKAYHTEITQDTLM